MKINKKIEVQNLNELFDTTCSNRTEYSTCWLNVSINNYNTAFVLFKNNIYCHAIFFMQQSIECLIKAILIENNLISFSDIKSANHRPEQALDENLIDKIERVDWLQKLILTLLVKLTHKSLGSIEQHTLLERFSPQHLHLHNKLSVLYVTTPNVHNTVLAYVSVGHKLG